MAHDAKMALGRKAMILMTLGVTIMTSVGVRAAQPAPAETKAERDARMEWWRQARFGMFIHWGVYSVAAGSWRGKHVPGPGEWLMHAGHVPVRDYATLAPQFNPAKFDADAWVRLAKRAGAKYIVITAKHHDGFAMFHSAASPYNIYDATPFKRDPLKELAVACRRQGMRLGFYYSQAQDWHHPGGASWQSPHWDKAQDGSFDEYLQKIAVPQVREILSNYGKVSVLWWDTPESMTQARAEMFLPLLKLQPGIITNDRLGGGYNGDSATPEQVIPDTGFPGGRDWETCMTMNETWGFRADDHQWKSPETLIRNLADIASKGGNYLLNVGPTAQGEIPQPSVERLEAIGAWMAVNGASIYGTSASPFEKPAWGRTTQKPGKLYLHVFDWPKDGKLIVPELKNEVKKAYLLSDPKKRRLKVEVGAKPEGGVSIQVGPAAPDKVDSVMVVEIAGEIGTPSAPRAGM